MTLDHSVLTYRLEPVASVRRVGLDQETDGSAFVASVNPGHC